MRGTGRDPQTPPLEYTKLPGDIATIVIVLDDGPVDDLVAGQRALLAWSRASVCLGVTDEGTTAKGREL